MKKIRIIALVLAVLTAAACFASCGKTENPAESTTTAAASTSAPVPSGQDDTTAPETELSALNRLGKRDLGAETVTFYSRSYNGDWTSDMMYLEVTGESVRDAIASRNLRIMSEYNVKLEERKSGAQSFFDKAEKELGAGQPDFDVLYVSMRDAAQMSVDGYLREIGSVPNIQVNEAWWSPFLQPQLSIAKKTYYVTGEITTVDDISIRAVFFNKTMLGAIDSGVSLYDKVDKNEWNLEYMFTLVNTALDDVGMDGKIELGNDSIGLLAEGTLGYQLLMGTGEKIIAKDANDVPVISVGGSRPLDVIDWLTTHIANNLSVQTASSVYKPFAEGKILFALVTIARENDLKGYDVDFGLVPYPKYNADQDKYHCYSDSYCPNAIAFPFAASEARIELASFVCEALAIESVNTVTPQFYDVCMKMRNARDERTGSMLDIIRDNYMIDLADVFLNTWGLRTPITKAISDGSSITTTVSTLERPAKKSIDSTVKKISELNH